MQLIFIAVITSTMISIIVSYIISLALIYIFVKYNIGHRVRLDGPSSHFQKCGTPPMGGIAIIASAWIGYMGICLINSISSIIEISTSSMLVLSLTTVLGLVGFIDDLIKLWNSRSLGFTIKSKFLCQLTISVIFSVLMVKSQNIDILSPSNIRLLNINDIISVNIFSLVCIFIYTILISSWSNALNLTDGLDGLLVGLIIIVSFSYVIIITWQYQHSCIALINSKCYDLSNSSDLIILPSSVLGSCIGFLCWNSIPARIFMGDTGSLALGGLIAGLSIASHTEILVIILGLTFVVEIVSVAIQIFTFRTIGYRFFRMTPLHHHFELCGWAESRFTISLWLITVLFSIFGLVLFYSEWLSIIMT